MTMRRRRGAAGGRGRLPSARVEWLPVSDVGANPSIALTAANSLFRTVHYDFGSAFKYADNFGAGDWTFERLIGSFGGTVVVAGGARKVIKVCLGVGMVQGATSISTSTDATDIGDPANNPDLSWMVEACCYFDIGATNEPVRCELNVRSRRRISPESQLYVVVAAQPPLAGAESIDITHSIRYLVRQRGSRL